MEKQAKGKMTDELFLQISNLKFKKDSEGYGYKYTSLESLHAQIKPILSKAGVTLKFLLKGSTIALQLDGEDVSYLDLDKMLGGGNMSQAQLMGSAMTYAKRYMLVCYFDLDTDEDTDGANPDNEASNTNKGYAIIKSKYGEGIKDLKTNKVHWSNQPGFEEFKKDLEDKGLL